MEKKAEQQKAMAKVIAKAWSDEGFKKRLLAQPMAVLVEHGVEVPAGVELKAVENTDKVAYFVLPAMPTGAGAEEMEERLAMLEMHDEDQVAQLGVPGKRGNREIRMGADSILARGQSLSFSRVLYARFPNPMMLARVEMGKDHCIFLLAEEAMFDRDREANA